jgi:prevent-host-death family protein
MSHGYGYIWQRRNSLMSVALDRPVPAEAATGPFADALARAEHDKARVVLTRDGKPVAALVPIEDVAVLEAWQDEQDARLGEQALAEWEAQGRPKAETLEEFVARWGIQLDPDAA